MLDDRELGALDTRLEFFKTSNQTNQDQLQTLLKEHARLLQEYKVLKNRTQAGNEHQIPANVGKDSYVLVVIDGNGYAFEEELAKSGSVGGARAARMLNEAVRKHIDDSLPHLRGRRIMVRVYADFRKLATLGTRKDPEAFLPKFAAFAGGFSTAIDSFDFVPVPGRKGARFKVAASFKVGVEDDTCSHILFAGCHDRSYLAMLQFYSAMRDKITLVRVSEFKSEYSTMGFNHTSFPGLFKWVHMHSSSELSTPSPSVQGQIENRGAHTEQEGPESDDWSENTKAASVAQERQIEADAEPCKFFQKDSCRYGSKCRFQHQILEQRPGLQDNPKSGKWQESRNWRALDTPKDLTSSPTHSRTKSTQEPTIWKKNTSNPSEKQESTPKDEEIWKPSNSPHVIKHGTTMDPSSPSSSLLTSAVSGFIPLNASNQRLDTYLRAPTSTEWDAYTTRFKQRKPCNMYHLQNACAACMCPYDHSPLEPEIKKTLEFVVRKVPCQRGSACRDGACVFGHVCLKKGCEGQNGSGCRMKKKMHGVDMNVEYWVPVEEDLVHGEISEVEAGAGEADQGETGQRETGGWKEDGAVVQEKDADGNWW
ncbi:hypothetical protein P154DRAFT_489398 [Amniculicola lignicola CBS 123094]|uniref:C3H1-type domain-containing protein n=1 Tax=Amniculicola lignicola CBS 123094 TaxID=1392246 RepID=A0A6A5WJR3_9PLEO|nr:hypothetical protein P154DRAFT_489398 [Amniculicola lignicola CBS 123094]